MHEKIYACVQTVCFSTVARAPSVGFAASSLPEGALRWLIGNFGRTMFAPTVVCALNFDLWGEFNAAFFLYAMFA